MSTNDNKNSVVEIYINETPGKMFTEEHRAPRKYTGKYYTTHKGEAACEEAFKLTNAPREFLTPDELELFNVLIKECQAVGRRLRSLSVGDCVVVDNVPYLCKGIGWEQIETYEG